MPMNPEHHHRDLQAASLIAAANPTASGQLLSPSDTSTDRPKVVTLCGSTRFWHELAEANFRETLAGHAVLAPGCGMKKAHPMWEEPAAAAKLKTALDALHRWKIRACDEVLVVNPGGYIGDSTRAEQIAAGLRGQLHHTLHVEGTVITTGAFRPDLDHLDPEVPGDPYALAEAMDTDPGGIGRNFPDLYARLCAQEPETASDLWQRACWAYEHMRATASDE
ncbi:hypothetical protein ACIQKB_37805 [Streptomyces sp. NPDC092046]|uniref:hypothetical protein n=1 Tax=Streptomyces sp. NPDC092046 TaxID=3366009 RepID=UPI003829A6A6